MHRFTSRGSRKGYFWAHMALGGTIPHFVWQSVLLVLQEPNTHPRTFFCQMNSNQSSQLHHNHLLFSLILENYDSKLSLTPRVSQPFEHIPNSFMCVCTIAPRWPAWHPNGSVGYVFLSRNLSPAPGRGHENRAESTRRGSADPIREIIMWSSY